MQPAVFLRPFTKSDTPHQSSFASTNHLGFSKYTWVVTPLIKQVKRIPMPPPMGLAA